MTRLLFSSGIIITGISLGYIIQRLDRKGSVTLPLPIDHIRKLLQKIALIYLCPISIGSAIWLIKTDNIRLAALPFLGFFALTSGGLFAFILSRLMKLPPRQKGAYIGCGAFTNLVAIGGLICYVFLGEKGFALFPIYKMFEELFNYAIGFPVARFYSGAKIEGSFMKRISSLVCDPFIISSIVGIGAGFILNLGRVRRPEFFSDINSILIPSITFLLLLSIGLALRFSKLKKYIKESLSIAAIKFILVPVIITSIALLLGFKNIDNGLPLKVVIILSSMPVAFIAMIPPSIYDLDIDLANSCWFVTTALMIVILPILLMITSSF